MTRAGAGIAMLPDFMIGTDDALVLACPDDPPLLREVWLVFHTDMKAQAPVRMVIDCLRCNGSKTLNYVRMAADISELRSPTLRLRRRGFKA